MLYGLVPTTRHRPVLVCGLGLGTPARPCYTRQNIHVWLLAGHLGKEINAPFYSGLPGQLIIKTIYPCQCNHPTTTVLILAFPFLFLSRQFLGGGIGTRTNPTKADTPPRHVMALIFPTPGPTHSLPGLWPPTPFPVTMAA